MLKFKCATPEEADGEQLNSVVVCKNKRISITRDDKVIYYTICKR